MAFYGSYSFIKNYLYSIKTSKLLQPAKANTTEQVLWFLLPSKYWSDSLSELFKEIFHQNKEGNWLLVLCEAVYCTCSGCLLFVNYNIYI